MLHVRKNCHCYSLLDYGVGEWVCSILLWIKTIFFHEKDCFASFSLLGCVLSITEYSTSCDFFFFFFNKEDNYSKATKNNEEEQWLGSEKATSCLNWNHRIIDRNHVTSPLGIMHHLADMQQDVCLCLLFIGLIRDLARSSLTSVEKWPVCWKNLLWISCLLS